ncbi:ABC transporter permease subunit [Streptomyces sp. NBC_00433]
MKNQLRSEAYKMATTRGNAGLAAAMLGLVGLAILVHVLSLSAQDLATRSQQLSLFIDVGVNLAALFAALVGALAVTGEYRTRTIRPTLLAQPRRATVITAKAACVLVAGAVTGLLSAGAAAGIGSIALAGRGFTNRLTAADITQLLTGAAGGGALWAAIGLGVGAAIRAQVPAVVGLFAWVLFVENTLVEIPRVERFAPGALAKSLAGQTDDGILASGALAALLLLAYAAVATGIALRSTARRDLA